MKKLLLSTIAASVIAFNVQADVITFDPAGDGSTSMQIDEIGMQIQTGDYEVQQYFHGGADDSKLDNGDLFTESFVYTLITANNGGSEVGFWKSIGGSATTDKLEFEINLSGYISNVFYNEGVPTIGDADFATDFAATSFNTVFSPTTSAPGTGMTVKYNGDVIGVFDVTAGVSTAPVQLDGAVLTGFELKFDFNDAWRSANSNGVDGLFEKVWSHSNGSPFTAANDFNFALAQGSAGPTGDGFDKTGVNGSALHLDGNGTIAGEEYFSVAVDDNGADLGFNVPEPTTLAILGLGLLGFAGTRRRS